jgi:hypothetical protein
VVHHEIPENGTVLNLFIMVVHYFCIVLFWFVVVCIGLYRFVLACTY